MHGVLLMGIRDSCKKGLARRYHRVLAPLTTRSLKFLVVNRQNPLTECI